MGREKRWGYVVRGVVGGKDEKVVGILGEGRHGRSAIRALVPSARTAARKAGGASETDDLCCVMSR